MMLRSSSVPTIGEAVQSTTFARKKSAPIHTTATLNATKNKNDNEKNLNAAWAAFRNQNDFKQGSGVVEDSKPLVNKDSLAIIMTRLKNRPKTGVQKPKTPTGLNGGIFKEQQATTATD